MRHLNLLTLLPFVLLSASDLSAQACLGLPSFANGAIHLNVGAEFPDSAQVIAAGVGLGRHNSVFGTVGGGQVTFEGLDGKSKFGFADAGLQLPVGRAQVCPIIGAALSSGPDDDALGITVKSRSLSGGLAMGLPLALPFGGTNLKLIPNAAIKYEHATLDVEDELIGSSRETFTTGIADFGLALVFADRFSIQPLAHIFFGGDNDETSFGVFASLSFGPRR